jgi:putative MFS transporter
MPSFFSTRTLSSTRSPPSCAIVPRRAGTQERLLTTEDPASARPGWLRLAPFLHRAPPLTRREWNVLGLVSLVSLFETYDVYLFSLNLAHIQRELGIGEAQLGGLGGLVRAGALGAVLVTLAADRLGRRRLLVFTALAYTLLTGATALAPSTFWFVAFQLLARVFSAAEGMLAVVVIAEEFDARHRGWGIGALGAITACGGGLAALAFAFVEWLPYGWRALYAVGLVPLAALAWWRRAMPETERFLALARARSDGLRAAPAFAPLGALLRGHPRRLLALAGAAFLATLVIAPAVFFAPKYLQDVHGWSPGAVAMLNFLGGAFAIVANPLAGRLSDRRGRRPVTALFLLGAALLAVSFYLGPAWLLGPLWAAMMFATMGGETTLAAYGAELFPTAYRSTASGARAFVSTLGTVGGLAAVSLLYPWVGSNWRAIALLGALALLSPLLVWLAFPETSGRSLEDIAEGH